MAKIRGQHFSVNFFLLLKILILFKHIFFFFRRFLDFWLFFTFFIFWVFSGFFFFFFRFVGDFGGDFWVFLLKNTKVPTKSYWAHCSTPKIRKNSMNSWEVLFGLPPAILTEILISLKMYNIILNQLLSSDYFIQVWINNMQLKTCISPQ